jgi:hypothetical protein
VAPPNLVGTASGANSAPQRPRVPGSVPVRDADPADRRVRAHGRVHLLVHRRSMDLRRLQPGRDRMRGRRNGLRPVENAVDARCGRREPWRAVARAPPDASRRCRWPSRELWSLRSRWSSPRLAQRGAHHLPPARRPRLPLPSSSRMSSHLPPNAPQTPTAKLGRSSLTRAGPSNTGRFRVLESKRACGKIVVQLG